MIHGEENRRVLIVDDNPAIHTDFRKVLEVDKASNDALEAIAAEMFGDAVEESRAAQFEVDSAYQGKEALEKVKESIEKGRPYAMAFVDIRMPPGWDGVETIAELWKVDPNLEVVICSAYSDYGWEDMVRRLGSTDRLLVLKKPFESVEVIQLAHALTQKWDLQRAGRLRAIELEQTVSRRTVELQDMNERLVQEMKERQEMEAELRLSQKLEAVGQLAAGIAHEINTPMQYIGDNTHFLKTAFSNMMAVVDAYETAVESAVSAAAAGTMDQAKAVAARNKLSFLRNRVPRALDATLEGVGNVSRIVQAMKNFSHVDNEERVPSDINAAIESTVTISKNEWKYVADMNLELDPSMPLVPCFAGELNQVILNLIVNAAHAVHDFVDAPSGERGTITIRTSHADGHAEISITDTGGGISENVRDRIFDPFFTTKEVGRGTGQGLSIARRIVVEKHGGDLSFDTESGKGTTFFIRIPMGIAEHGAVEAG